MKGRRRSFLGMFLVLACIFAVLAWPKSRLGAVTYYVSSSSGNDANDGLSPERAWRHLSTIYLKSTARGSFQPGDSILLKRGDQWNGQLRLQAIGTEADPIRIGAYGEGAKPLLFGTDEQLHWEAVPGYPAVYATDLGDGSIIGAVVMEGKTLKMISPTGSLNRKEDAEVFFSRLQARTLAGGSGSRIWIRAMDSRHPPEAVRVLRVAGVLLSDSSYVRIENLDIERFYTGIDVSNSRQVVIDHNDIQDVLGIGIYLRSGDVNCQVESNTVYRSGNTALYVLKGTGSRFRDNWISHVDKSILGIAAGGDGMGIGLQESHQTLVEYNYFAHSGGIDFYFEQGSTVRYNYLYRVRSAGAPHGVDLMVYGNIYNLGGAGPNSGSTGVNAVATGPGTIEVFNNTIFNASGFFLKGSSDKGGRILFSDNIVSSSVAGGAALTLFAANVASSHNCFSSPGQAIFRYKDKTFDSFKAYQSETGLDGGSIFSDPHFLNPAPLTPLDFRPSVNSECNAPASNIASPDPVSDRTYDHDSLAHGGAVVGALRAPTQAAAAFVRRCQSQCFQKPFEVPAGVYLVRLTFAPAAQTPLGHRFNFVLEGREIVADFTSSDPSGRDGNLAQSFLVRPSGPSITLRPDAGSDISAVKAVDITLFDNRHGEGPQVIPW